MLPSIQLQIQHLEKVIETLIQDVHLLEHKLLQSKITSKK
jgi:hypothetical protein